MQAASFRVWAVCWRSWSFWKGLRMDGPDFISLDFSSDSRLVDSWIQSEVRSSSCDTSFSEWDDSEMLKSIKSWEKGLSPKMVESPENVIFCVSTCWVGSSGYNCWKNQSSDKVSHACALGNFDYAHQLSKQAQQTKRSRRNDLQRTDRPKSLGTYPNPAAAHLRMMPVHLFDALEGQRCNTP